MKKRTWELLAGAFLAGMLFCCACGASDRHSAKKEPTDHSALTQNKAEKNPQPSESLPELRIGVDDLKPFFYVDQNGDYAGIDAEIAMEACRRAGYQPVFQNVTWDVRDQYLEAGNLDCLWSACAMDGREARYHWTDPYLESKLAVLVDAVAPDQDIDTFNGPGGVAVRAGSKAEELLLERCHAASAETGIIYSCGTLTMAETAFVKGYANAFACHQVVLDQLMRENPGAYRYLGEPLMAVHLGVAFAKDADTPYRDQINEALASMKQDGTIVSIAKEYGLDLTREEEAAR